MRSRLEVFPRRERIDLMKRVKAREDFSNEGAITHLKILILKYSKTYNKDGRLTNVMRYDCPLCDRYLYTEPTLSMVNCTGCPWQRFYIGKAHSCDTWSQVKFGINIQKLMEEPARLKERVDTIYEWLNILMDEEEKEK